MRLKSGAERGWGHPAILFLILIVSLAFVPGLGAQEGKGEPPPAMEGAAPGGEQEGEEPTATLIFNKGKMDQILAALSKQTGVNVVPIGKVKDLRIDIIAQNEPVSSILQKIAGTNKLRLHRIDDMNFELMDEKTYQTEVLPKKVIRKIFVLKYIKAEEARKALQNVVTKNIGQMAADPRTNKLIVTDLPQAIELIKRILDEIDVQLVTRVFYIRHADIKNLADKLKNYKSAPGTIEVDAKTHQIIVQDIFQVIKRMEMLVEVLDIGPEIRVYNLNNIGKEGKGAEQLRKAIEQVITKDADVFWQIDEDSGTLVVQDVPEVHEKIEQILAALDKPVKQVLIYAEMIETKFNKKYDFGVEWEASRDLFTATRDGLFGDLVPTGTQGPLEEDLGFLNLSREFPTVIMDGNGIAVQFLNKYFRGVLSASLDKSDSRVLLQPRLIVKNQEEAKIHVGGTKAYRTTNYYTDNAYQSSSGQARITYGLEVDLQPSISNNGLIELEITITNSSPEITGDPNDPLVGETKASAKTTLIIPSGETRVLAGLLKNSDSHSKTGVPFFSEIPVIGPALFGKYSETNENSNILFFLTPTIIEEKPSRENYYRGKSIEEFLQDADAIPPDLLELTTPTLAGVKPGVLPDAKESLLSLPALSSDRPLELPQLLGNDPDLDAATLRQKRTEVTAGPSGSFSTEEPEEGKPTAVGPKGPTPSERRPRSKPVPPKIDPDKDEPIPERPRRPVGEPETQY